MSGKPSFCGHPPKALATAKSKICRATPIRNSCKTFGVKLGISTAAYLHLAASIPNLMLAVDNQQPNLTDDIVVNPHSLERGSIAVPNGVDLGMALDLQKLAHYHSDKIGDPYLDQDRPDWFPTKPQY